MTKKSTTNTNQFDYYHYLNESLDEISRRQGVDVDLMDAVKPMSTGTLILDLILGGGIRPAMYTSAGWEQSCKTTGALSIIASAIKQGVPLISHWDFEGCVIGNTTFSVEGKPIQLQEIFDLTDVSTWPEDSWVPQYAQIDTIDPNCPDGVSSRTAQLFYKGIAPTTKVTLESGHTLTGYNHPIFVRSADGSLIQKRIEELLPGDEVMIKKSSF
jgi:hypothetical protein